MARKFNNSTKVITFIIIGAFVFAGLYSAFQSVRSWGNPNNKTIMTMDGIAIKEMELKSEVASLKDELDKFDSQKRQFAEQQGAQVNITKMPDELLEKIALSRVIDRKMYKKAAKDLKVGVSKDEINKQMKEIEDQFGSKQNFEKYLGTTGQNKTSIRLAITDQLEAKNVSKKIVEKATPLSDEKVKQYYDRFKYQEEFSGREFNDLKDSIKQELSTRYEEELGTSYFSKKMEETNFELKDERYKSLFDDLKTSFYDKDGYKLSKKTIYDQIYYEYIYVSPTGYNEGMVKSLEDKLKKDTDTLVVLANKAKEVGIKLDENLYGLELLKDTSNKYYFHLIDNYKPNDMEMKEYYDKNRVTFKVERSISGYVLGDIYLPSKEDKNKLKKEVEEKMKNITPQNFADRAKELSEDPGSKDQGGKLGDDFIDITQFVPEFRDAAQKGKKGEIIGPIETEYGVHIIYIEDKDPNNENLAKLSHILMTAPISEESRKNADTKIAKLKEQLDKEEVKWVDVNKQEKYKYEVKEEFKKLTEKSLIPGIGEEAAKQELFASLINQTTMYKSKIGTFLMVKTAEEQARELSFEESKDKIRLILAFNYADKEVEKLVQK